MRPPARWPAATRPASGTPPRRPAGSRHRPGRTAAAGTHARMKSSIDSATRERLQVVDHLLVDPQRPLTGGEHPHARTCRKHPAHRLGQLRDQMLTVVEHQQQRGPPQPIEDGRLSGRVEVERLAHAGPDRGRRTGTLQAHQPDPTGRQLAGQPGLAHSGRADHGGQTVLADEPAHRRDVGFPPDQRRRDAGRSGNAGRQGERGILAEDLRLQGLQLHPRIQPQLIVEQPLDPAVGGKRIRLPTGLVERGDQQPPQTLAERMRGHQCLQLPDHLTGGPEGDAGREVVLGEPQPDLLQTRTMGREPGAVATIGQYLAMEHRQGGRAAAGGGRGISGRAERRSRLGEPQHLTRIDPAAGRRRGCSRHAPPVTRPGSPSARRSIETLDCKVFGATPTPCSDHRSSSRRSVRTSSPASTASRTSSSVALPAGSIQASTVAPYLGRPQNGHTQHTAEPTAHVPPRRQSRAVGDRGDAAVPVTRHVSAPRQRPRLFP